MHSPFIILQIVSLLTKHIIGLSEEDLKYFIYYDLFILKSVYWHWMR